MFNFNKRQRKVSEYMEEWIKMLSYNTGGSLGTQNKKAVNLVFGRSPWYRMLVAKRGRDIARVKLLLWDTSGDERKLIKDHAILKLLAKFNSEMVGMQARSLLQIWYDNVGEWLLWKERNIRGEIINLFPINPDKIIRKGSDSVDWEIYSEAGSRFIKNSEVIYCKDINPFNEYERGAGQGQAASDELAVSEKIMKMLGVTFDNRAVPPFIVTFDGVDDSAIEEARQNWFNKFKGFLKAGIPMFTNSKVDIKRLAYNFEETKVFELNKESKDMMRKMWGIPDSLIGEEMNSNKATSLNAWNIYSDNVLSPNMDLVVNILNVHLVPEFGDNLELGYENPSKADEQFILDTIKAFPMAFKTNEIRRLAKHEEWESEAGETVWAPLNFTNEFQPALPGEVPKLPDPEPEEKITPKLKKKSEIKLKAEEDEPDLAMLLAMLAFINPDDLFLNVKASYINSIESEAIKQLETLGIGEDVFNPNSKDITDYLNDVKVIAVGGIILTMKKRLTDTIKKAKDEGLTVTQIIKRINDDVFDRYKKRDFLSLIKDTEGSATKNFALVEAGKQSRIGGIKKEWITQRDDKVRDSHLIDGQIRDLDDKFELADGVRVAYPGDITAPVEDRANERCVLAYNRLRKSFAGSTEEQRFAYWNSFVKSGEEIKRVIGSSYARAFQNIQIDLNNRLKGL